MSRWTFITVLILTLWSLYCCSAQFVVVAPNLVRTDSVEHVFLQSPKNLGRISVNIKITDFNTQETLTLQSVTLNKTNGFHTLAPIQVPSDSLRREEKVNKYVNMEVKFGDNKNKVLHTETRAIMVSFHSGYIFIQTDKPIYKPEDTVRLRLFVSSPTFKTANLPVSVDIKNPEDIVIDQTTNKMPKKGILTISYVIPKIATEGKWTVMARFDHWPQNNFNMTFEVKKYVLPAFKVTFELKKPFLDVEDTELSVDIRARYLYGDAVLGTAYVVYGLKKGKEIRRAPKVKQVEMEEEGGTLKLNVTDITQACEVHLGKQHPNCSIRALVDSYVYLKVSVLTESGGDLVEVEKSNIKIVNSPYVLALTDMQKYFKPGSPFHFTIHVTYHDGTPAHEIPLSVSHSADPVISSRGTAGVSINMPNEASAQTITVQTKDSNLKQTDRQAHISVTVNPYIPTNPSRPNYLYIHSRSHRAELRELTLEMSIRSDQRDSVAEISYLIVSKGKILEAKRVEARHQQITSVTTRVTPEMMPSFRFVAFYTLGTEVVSDSIKLEVSETCVNPIHISARDSKSSEYTPGSKLKLNIRAEPRATVSLVAVDQAVYLLSKNRFTQKHILAEVDSRDFGCTGGSGQNPMGVFSDAGLLFAMKDGPFTHSRQELSCGGDARRRRSTPQMEQQTQLLEQFQNSSLQRCCRDGLRGVLMPYSCEQRSEFITDGLECVTAFLKCCNVYKKKMTSRRRGDLSLGRSRGSGSSSDVPDPDDNDALWELGDEDEDEEYDVEKIRLRDQLQETWFWMDFNVPAETALDGLATLQLEQPVPDSITEWSILAVSSSTKTGFCVAEPWTFVAKQRFFVDLKLPFSVARNEQVEIKAVVYNYMDDPVDVNVVLQRTRDMCSVAFKRSHKQKITVRPGSSTVVPYTIVPFKAGKIPIQVAAYVVNQAQDRVEKVLNVVVEGVQKTESKLIDLKPSEHPGNTQVVQTSKPELRGLVPNSEPQTKIKLSGHRLADTVDKAIRDDPLVSLIRMPGGCVEQNLASITFPVIATLYLDRSKGWEAAGVQRKIQAFHYVKTGYSKQLNYKRSDGSYPPYAQLGPSTWITAYVVKVFTMVYTFNSEIVNIDNICHSVQFLLKNKHGSDGSFTESHPATHLYMIGGLVGSDTARMTAFVTIALAEVRQANIDCSYMEANIEEALKKTVPYLKAQLDRPPPSPYTTAIISYALALIGDATADPTSRLLAAATDDTYWHDADSLVKLEATGYALLALVKMGKLTEAKKPFDYLSQNRNIGNTQTAMVTLQAMSEYLLAQPPPVEHSLDVLVTTATRRESLNFNPKTSYQLRSFNMQNDDSVTVEAKGNGMGTVEVVTFYNQLPEEDAKSCESFDMQVSVKKSTERPPPGTINVFELNVRVKPLGSVDAVSVVLDITLPTGFTVEIRDLQNLLNSVEKFINYFYFDDKLSDRSSLIIHLYRVSNTKHRDVAFRLFQQFNVGLLQPSSVTVYEYYKEKGQRCTQLYSPPQDQVQLTTICRSNICQCAQDDCCEIWRGSDDSEGTKRKTFACKTLHHVFKVKVHNVSSDYYVKYDLEITNIIKLGVEAGVLRSERRFFYSHSGCGDKCKLQTGLDYLIMGPESDRWTVDSNTNRYTYVLAKDTWVERWPTDAQCSEPAFQAQCQSLTKATDYISTEGCHSKK